MPVDDFLGSFKFIVCYFFHNIRFPNPEIKVNRLYYQGTILKKLKLTHRMGMIKRTVTIAKSRRGPDCLLDIAAATRHSFPET